MRVCGWETSPACPASIFVGPDESGTEERLSLTQFVFLLRGVQGRVGWSARRLLVHGSNSSPPRAPQDGCTPLHYAATGSIVEALVAAGASVSARTKVSSVPAVCRVGGSAVVCS